MKFVADFHIHSRYSRAVSDKMNVVDLGKYAPVKGVNLMGTGDFTHPKYFEELKKNLAPAGNGTYKCGETFFVISSEVSTIFSVDKKVRKVHNVLLAPSLEIAAQVTDGLKKWGRVDYDGRPVFGRTCIELADLCISVSKDIEIIPAHAWTPWFSIFGSMSGFDSVEECFGDRTKHIHALETGMSSDPAMNWRLSQLDKFALVSFSDSHSPYSWRLGREACVFDLKSPDYFEMVRAIREKDSRKFLYTIETSPAYGKYHWDGHRACNFSCSPQEAVKLNNICPVCKKQLTIGVEHRVEELADRPAGFVPKGAIPFKTLIPLAELVAALFKTSVASKTVFRETDMLIKTFGSELSVLLDVPGEKLRSTTHEKIADAVLANREGKVQVKPGFDGVYGEPLLGATSEETKTMRKAAGQKTLGDY